MVGEGQIAGVIEILNLHNVELIGWSRSKIVALCVKHEVAEPAGSGDADDELDGDALPSEAKRKGVMDMV